MSVGSIVPGEMLGAIEPVAGLSVPRLLWRRLRRDPVALVAAAVLLFMTLLAIGAPLLVAITGHSATDPSLEAGTDAYGQPLAPGTDGYAFGTDNLGRDILVRVAYGARASLALGTLAAVIGGVIGVIAGLVAGYRGGLIDAVLARLIDAVLSFPYLVMALALASVYGPGLGLELFVIVFFTWAAVARVIRGQTLSHRAKDYVTASRSLGASDMRIMFVDILPNLAGPIIVLTSLIIPTAIIFEASISFLGIGVAPPDASWGNMLSDAETVTGYQAWWFWLVPALALFVTTLAFNVLGDAFRDALDPRSDRVRRGAHARGA